jgi:hypothetical protein
MARPLQAAFGPGNRPGITHNASKQKHDQFGCFDVSQDCLLCCQQLTLCSWIFSSSLGANRIVLCNDGQWGHRSCKEKSSTVSVQRAHSARVLCHGAAMYSSASVLAGSARAYCARFRIYKQPC